MLAKVAKEKHGYNAACWSPHAIRAIPPSFKLVLLWSDGSEVNAQRSTTFDCTAPFQPSVVVHPLMMAMNTV